MVGDPKRLSDLNKIEADVRIACRRCRFEEDWTVEALTAHLMATGGSTVWSEIIRHMRCRRFGCGSSDLRAIVVPYARRQPNMQRRISRLDEALVGTAVRLLEQATARSPGRDVASLDVRLALLVAHRYTRQSEPVRAFWERAGDASRLASAGLAEPLALIRHKLEVHGWLPAQVLTVPEKVWPWDSPAPPGWKGRAENDRSTLG